MRAAGRAGVLGRTAAVACATVLIAGCTPGQAGRDEQADWSVPRLGPAKVDVDTPALRRAKDRAGIASCEPGSAQAVEGGLPPVTLACFGGGPAVDLARLRGPLVVNLWAQWCAPCRREMPILQSFFARHGDRVAVLGVNYSDVQPERAMDFARRAGVTYPLVADPDARLEAAAPLQRVVALPFWALVDADGRIAYQASREIESSDELVGLVRQHLGVDL